MKLPKFNHYWVRFFSPEKPINLSKDVIKQELQNPNGRVMRQDNYITSENKLGYSYSFKLTQPVPLYTEVSNER